MNSGRERTGVRRSIRSSIPSLSALSIKTGIREIEMKKALSLAMACGFAVSALILLGVASDASARGRTGAANVDCDAGDSLQTALNKGFDDIPLFPCPKCICTKENMLKY